MKKYYFIDEEKVERSLFVESEEDLKSLDVYKKYADKFKEDKDFEKKYAIMEEARELSKKIAILESDPEVLRGKLKMLQSFKSEEIKKESK